jgi:hypothetical protein
MLLAVIGLLVAAPAPASARGWRGGGWHRGGFRGHYVPRAHFFPRVHFAPFVGLRVFVPGYWGWGGRGYYWNEGAWMMAPRPGAAWVPPGWNWDPYAQQWVWRQGYWSY